MPKRAELKLSRSVVEGLSVEGGDRVFWDRALPGFGVRVHATGRKTYVVQCRGPSGTPARSSRRSRAASPNVGSPGEPPPTNRRQNQRPPPETRRIHALLRRR